jgi:hypothetical protein
MNLLFINNTVKVLFLFVLFTGLTAYGHAQCGSNTVIGDTVYVTSDNNIGGSLRNAILCANDLSNTVRFIHFNISDPGVITIQPAAPLPLPPITKNDVVIDARTQPGWFLGKIVLSGGLIANAHGLTVSADNVSIYGLYITGFTSTSAGGGILLNNSGALISTNALSGNRYGIQTIAPISFTATNNIIGLDPSTSTAAGNVVAGVNIQSTFGSFEVSNNTIAYNGTGIVDLSGVVDVLISQNSMYCNTSKGIERMGFTAGGFAITNPSTTIISGTAPSGTVVEVFTYDDSPCATVGSTCQGTNLLGSAVANSSSIWTLNLAAGTLNQGDQITATATIGGTNTTEFLSCSVIVCPNFTVSFPDVNDACGTTATGSATASANGTGPFTFEWSNGQTGSTASNLSPGIYTVTATQSDGCTEIGTLTIGSLPLPSVNPTANTPLCEGETLQLNANASGGTPNYSFLWEGPSSFNSTLPSPSISNIELTNGGLYEVTVTDANNCTGRMDISVIISESPTFQLVPQDISCNEAADGSIDLTPDVPSSTLTYNWSNGATTQDINNLTPGTYTVSMTDSNGCTSIDSETINEPTALSLNITGQDASCDENNGSANAVANGGTPGYTYNWSNGSVGPTIGNLAPGNYTVTATDQNNCTAIQGVSIGNSPALSLSATANAANCNGTPTGSIQLSLLSGSPPITYSWSNGANTQNIANLNAGSYAVTATDSEGCEFISTYDVTEPSAIILNVNSQNASCGLANGAASASASGGTPPINFTWSNGMSGATISNLLPGIYEVTATDFNGCSTTTSTSVGDIAGPVLSADVVNINCNGDDTGSIDLSVASGTPPFSYSWSNGANSQDIVGLTAATYTVTTTDANDCEAILSIEVFEPPIISVSNIQAQSPSMAGGMDGQITAELGGGTPPYQYSWTGPTNGSSTLNTAGLILIDNLSAGAYQLTILDNNGCSINQPFIINQVGCNIIITGIEVEDESCIGSMDGSIQISVEQGEAPFTYNWISGINMGSGAGTLINDLSAGDYNITITAADACTVVSSVSINTTTIDPPGTTQLSACEDNGGEAIFDLSSLEGTMNGDPNLTVIWTEDADGQLMISNPDTYLSESGNVFAYLSDGICTSITTPIQLIVLPENDPACVTDCSTFAGSMDLQDLISACIDVSIEAVYNNDAFLETEDSLLFVLHTLAGDSLGTVIQFLNSPLVQFDLDLMQPNTIYYLSPIAGPQFAGGGGIDLNSDCLSVSPGQAIAFESMNLGMLNFIQGEDLLCQGEELLLSTNDLADSTLTYYWITPNQDTIATNTPDLSLGNIQPSDAGDYYVFIQNSDCLFDQTGPFTLEVLGLNTNETIHAGSDTTVCDNAIHLIATPILSGNGLWTALEGQRISNPTQANTFVEDLQAGINTFVWTVSTTECGTVGSDTIIITLAEAISAVDDAFTLEQANTEIFMDVLKNDNLPEGVSYTLTAITQPDVGTLLQVGDGFQYFENEGFRGEVSFAYEVCYEEQNCPTSCATATVTIDVLNLPYLPEGFSPNDDGINDDLVVLGYRSGGDISMQLTITNRWGDIVYYSGDYLQATPWDGRSGNSNEPLVEGTYYALQEINVDGLLYERTQTIYIIK